eukprot:TRINITY_DN406_c0_g1_i18.p1 TRINITY_DN406_c0_g1~~TRINITY_DN406_c0_g1_i18.p1  ORF type:complete len:436 (+),score=115.65 TRINITY_DN406_c0_g1_i18:399-1706(+)
MFIPTFTVRSPHVSYTEEAIEATYRYETTQVETDGATGAAVAVPTTSTYHFRTGRHVGRVGLLLVGLGGNNGTTVTAAIAANRRGLSWRTKGGTQAANYLGSILMSSTVRVGADAATGEEVHAPLRGVLPMAHPNDLVIGGWDINGADLGTAMRRAAVLDVGVQVQVEEELASIKPLPSVMYGDFIAANQADRADNLLPGNDKGAHLERIRADIREFKAANHLDTVVVLWTANTERFADVLPGVNDSADALLASIKASHAVVSPSTLFAVASILEGCPYVNGSPKTPLCRAPSTWPSATTSSSAGTTSSRGKPNSSRSSSTFWCRPASAQPPSRRTTTSATMTGATCRGPPSSAPRRLARARSLTMSLPPTSSSTRAARMGLPTPAPTTSSSSSTCRRSGIASAPWTSTRPTFLWAAPTPLSRTTRARIPCSRRR